ncbi:MAG: VTT domain-containing protein [Nocardioides sp.]
MSLLALLPELHPLLLGIKWMEPEWLLDNFGGTLIWISLVIIFVECGLFFPFLPGDTLLFALGLFIAGQKINVFGVDTPWVEMSVAIALLTIAAFLGNVIGYEIGRKLGPPLYRRNGRILKRKYLDSTSAFFDKHGNKALVIGRFVPFVRTYITVVAGVTMMERRRFFTWSAIGAILWVASISLLGYFLGRTFPSIGENIDYAIIAILIFTVAPLAYEALKHRRGRHKDEAAAPLPLTTTESSASPSIVE